MSDLNLIAYRIEDDGAYQEDNRKHFKDSPPCAEMKREKYDQWSAEYADRGSGIVNGNGFAPFVFNKIFSDER